MNKGIQNVLLIGPVTDYFGGDGVAGVGRHIECLAKYLTKENINVSIFYHKHWKKGRPVKGINVHGFSLLIVILYTVVGIFSLNMRDVRLKSYTLFQKFIIAYQHASLKKLINQNNFTAIHVHSLNCTYGICLMFLREKGVALPKLVFTDHGFWQNQNLVNSDGNSALKNIQWNIKMADSIIYISDFARKELNRFSLLSNKFVKIENPVSVMTLIDSDKVDSNIKKFLDRNDKKFTIFFNGISETIRIKQLDVLLSALDKNVWLKNNVKLVCISNKKGFDLIKDNLFDYPILPLSKQDSNTINYIYKHVDCLVNPSKSESFGLVYIEAIQHGKPIIGFDRVIEEFTNILGVEIGYGYNKASCDVKCLGKKIEKVLKKQWDCEKIQQLATYFNWDKQILKFIEQYKSE